MDPAINKVNSLGENPELQSHSGFHVVTCKGIACCMGYGMLVSGPQSFSKMCTRLTSTTKHIRSSVDRMLASFQEVMGPGRHCKIRLGAT